MQHILPQVTVGLDYADAFVRLCVLDEQGKPLCNRNVDNHAGIITAFAERYGHVRGCAIEACTGAADLAEQLVGEHGWSVHLAHPGYVRKLKQSPDKTDHSDAQLLADLERVGYLPRVWLAPQCVRQLRVLVRDRASLVDHSVPCAGRG